MTDIEMFILGLIGKKENNAYGLINEINSNYYYFYQKLPESTIYTTLKTLCKRGFLSSNKVKEGKYPAKTIYFFSELGKKVLEHSIKQAILDTKLPNDSFSIAILFLDMFTTYEIRILLEARLESIDILLDELNNRYSNGNLDNKIIDYKTLKYILLEKKNTTKNILDNYQIY